MKLNAEEGSLSAGDRLCTRALGKGLGSAGLILLASVIFRSSLPLELQLTAGLLVWSGASAFLLVAMLLSLNAFKATKRISFKAMAAITLPILAAVLIAFI